MKLQVEKEDIKGIDTLDKNFCSVVDIVSDMCIWNPGTYRDKSLAGLEGWAVCCFGILLSIHTVSWYQLLWLG